MGTRCLTKFYESDESKPFAVMYRQFDGYPEGHGAALAKFLAQRERVNGVGDVTADNAANGIGCLAAQVVAHFKSDPDKEARAERRAECGLDIGGIYLMSDGKAGIHGEEYIYEVHEANTEDWKIVVREVHYKRGSTVIFTGTPAGFPEYLAAAAKDEA